MARLSLDHIVWNDDVFQNSFYIGINIQNILYGMELLVYFKTIQTILSNRRTRRASDAFYAIFSSVMVFLTTVFVATEVAFGQHTWMLGSDFPGGDDAYWQKHITDWYVDWGTTSIIVLQLMTDALMIHRCRIVWDSHRAVVIPGILWVATFALGFLMDWTSSTPGADIFIGAASKLGLAYWSVSVFLNATLTCMICYRILRYGQRVQEHLGREHASVCFTVITIVVESVLPYTISGIAFLVSFGMKSPTSITFVSVYIQMMCISPQLLILRVIVGRAWDSKTSKLPRNSTLRFSFGATSASQESDSTAARVDLQVLSNVNLPEGDHKV